jgi:hypothetical protein
VTIFSLSLITKQKIDGVGSNHFNPVIKQKTRFNLLLKPKKGTSLTQPTQENRSAPT